jgi:hypothetical protein
MGKFFSKPNPAKDRIFDFPIFHHSIILPAVSAGMRQDYQASVNIYNFPALAG